MTYEQALQRLTGAKRLGAVPGLGTMARMMEKLGRPQDKLRFVHIAGTNGKGSTAAYLDAILRAAGYQTGLFTSPFIEDFRERIQVNGLCISEETAAELAERVLAAAAEAEAEGCQAATAFELVTALGLLHFARCACDIVVLEVGLGGRLDATNIIGAPEAAVLTRIGLDHTELLGDSLEKIAGEKAGIIKGGSAVAACDQDPAVLEVFRRAAREKGCPFAVAERGRLREISPEGLLFDWKNMQGLRTGLTGLHQLENAQTALAAVKILRERGWAIGEDAIRAGLSRARIPGRLEVLCKKPFFVVDGAHNAQGIAALAESLRALFPGRRWDFLVGMLADKAPRESLVAILPLAGAFFTITPPSPRAVPAAELAAELERLSGVPVRAFDTLEAALKALLAESGEEGLGCAFGSLYPIGAIRRFFRESV